MQSQMQDWGDVNEWNKINFNVVAYKNTQKLKIINSFLKTKKKSWTNKTHNSGRETYGHRQTQTTIWHWLSDILHFFQSPVLDFGKIIIYTSNLRIIKAPQKKPEMFRQHTVPLIDLEGYPKAKERGSRRRAKAVFTQEEAEKEEKQICDTDTKVMIHGQIILGGVVRFYHPISVSCFSHSRHVLLPIPLSLHVSSAIFSSLYLCFQENNCRIFFCFCLTPKSPLFPCKCKLVCILIRFLFYLPAATATNLLS